MKTSAKDQLILALDFPAPAPALDLMRRVAPHVGVFKIGLELFVAAGPPMVQAAKDLGAKIFLDLKFHDIPNTVAGAMRSALALGVDLTTIHLSGGPAMARAAADAAAGSGLLVLGVTLLTSSDAATLAATGVNAPVEDQVLRLARIASEAGLGGVVASPLEIGLLRQVFGQKLTIVTPGIRPAGTTANDQKRTLSATEAIRAGADYLVVGRPITAAPDPVRAAADLAAEIAGAQA